MRVSPFFFFCCCCCCCWCLFSSFFLSFVFRWKTQNKPTKKTETIRTLRLRFSPTLFSKQVLLLKFWFFSCVWFFWLAEDWVRARTKYGLLFWCLNIVMIRSPRKWQPAPTLLWDFKNLPYWENWIKTCILTGHICSRPGGGSEATQSQFIRKLFLVSF